MRSCECDKSCNVGEYVDYMNCKCRKRLIDNLVEKYNEDIDGNEVAAKTAVTYNVTLNDFELNKKLFKSWMLCVILLIVAWVLIVIGVSNAYLYFYRYIKRNSLYALSY